MFQHRLRAPLAAAQQGTHAGLEFFHIEGLDQVIIGTGIQAGDALGGAVAGGEDQHRQVVLLGAQLLQQVQAIEARQAEVEQQQIEAFRAQGMQGRNAILQPIQGVAFNAQCHANPLAKGTIIFDKE